MEPDNNRRRNQPPKVGLPQKSSEAAQNPLNTALSPAQGPNHGNEQNRAQTLECEIAALVDDLRAQPREPETRAVIPLDFFDRVDAVFARHRPLEKISDECFQHLAGIFDFADLHPDMDAELDTMPPLSPDFAAGVVSAIRRQQSTDSTQDG